MVSFGVCDLKSQMTCRISVCTSKSKITCRIWDGKKKRIYMLILLKEVGLGNLHNDEFGLNK